MTFKKHVSEKLTILCLLSTILASASIPAPPMGAGFQVDTMELCKSYEVVYSNQHQRHPGNCISVFDR